MLERAQGQSTWGKDLHSTSKRQFSWLVRTKKQLLAMIISNLEDICLDVKCLEQAATCPVMTTPQWSKPCSQPMLSTWIKVSRIIYPGKLIGLFIMYSVFEGGKRWSGHVPSNWTRNWPNHSRGDPSSSIHRDVGLTRDSSYPGLSWGPR